MEDEAANSDNVNNLRRERDIRLSNLIDSVDRLRESVRLEGIRAAEQSERFNQIISDLVSSSSNFLSGEASVASEERNTESFEVNGNNSEVNVNNEESSENGKTSFFDCNICLDLARDPVVTCCGHLFCWHCVYRWLTAHSVANECPVCKGEVTINTMIPIYGNEINSRGPEGYPAGVEIPARPRAQRVESLRQTVPADYPEFWPSMSEQIRHSLNSMSAEITALGEGLAPPFNDRESLSSIAAVIHSESTSANVALESGGNISPTASRVRGWNHEGHSRVSNVDVGESANANVVLDSAWNPPPSASRVREWNREGHRRVSFVDRDINWTISPSTSTSSVWEWNRISNVDTGESANEDGVLDRAWNRPPSAPRVREWNREGRSRVSNGDSGENVNANMVLDRAWNLPRSMPRVREWSLEGHSRVSNVASGENVNANMVLDRAWNREGHSMVSNVDNGESANANMVIDRAWNHEGHSTVSNVDNGESVNANMVIDRAWNLPRSMPRVREWGRSRVLNEDDGNSAPYSRTRLRRS